MTKEKPKYPLCINCAYHVANPEAKYDLLQHLCTHNMRVSLVTGLPAGNMVGCEYMRANQDDCGMPGRYFKDKNETSN